MLNTDSVAANEAGFKSLLVSILAEGAAQLAEANEHLKRVLYPPLRYDTTKIDPAEWPELPNGILTVMEPRATLRDQFAMAAMTGIITQLNVYHEDVPEISARRAYEHADRMMEARK
jgi:hypothetical protein